MAISPIAQPIQSTRMLVAPAQQYVLPNPIQQQPEVEIVVIGQDGQGVSQGEDSPEDFALKIIAQADAQREAQRALAGRAALLQDDGCGCCCCLCCLCKGIWDILDCCLGAEEMEKGIKKDNVAEMYVGARAMNGDGLAAGVAGWDLSR